jgi:two-component system, sensor histidine kinase
MADSSSARVHRVLIIEDDPDTRESLKVLLELDGHHVDVASDGADGLELARRAHPDVALVNIAMPGLDGFEVARRFRLAGEPIHLVAVTGFGRPEDRARAREAGFDVYLLKPVDPEDLTRVVAAAPHRNAD